MARRRQKKTRITKWDALDAVPVRNQLCQAQETPEGTVLLSVPVRQTRLVRLMKRLTSVPESKKIELDEIGSFVWRHCDGRTNVRALVRKLCQRFKLSYREGEVSLTQYLRTLAQKGLIGLAVRVPDAARNSKER